MSLTLRVNPIACAGHGMCAELLPELIELDPWGFPILASAAVPGELADHARRAASACPTLALLVGQGGGQHLFVAGVDVRPGRRSPG
jgi:ferredoxin